MGGNSNFSQMIQLQFSCPEELENMHKNSCGFYCDSCKKEVADFRGKSLSEIHKFRKENPTIECGVFNPDVVKENPKTIVHTIFRMAFAAVFVLGFNASVLFSQEVTDADSNVNVVKVEPSQIAYLSGTVVNHLGKPIRSTITYVLNKTRYEISTNEKGDFYFELPTELIGKSFSFELHAKGMYTKYLSVSTLAGKCYTFQVQMSKTRRGRKSYLMGRSIGCPSF